ncbi:TPA: DUF3732 domain-containing protein [Legionella pneumophila]
MRFHIEKIVLYGVKGQIRELVFHGSGLNILTGASKTGKSAIAEILSYCLGREEFSIPAGIIRDKVTWYSLIIRIGDEQIFIARKKPETTKKTSYGIFLDVGSKIKIPAMESLVTNTNLDGLSSFLSGKIGISENLQQFSEISVESKIEAKFKHSLTYCFQQQGEIADKINLFHRQNIEWTPNSIRLTMPYFLGAISEDEISLKLKIKNKRKQLNQLQNELSEAEKVHGEGITLGNCILAEAEELGIVKVKNEPNNIEDLISILQSIELDQTKSAQTIPGDAIDRLRNERDVLLVDYDNLNEQLKVVKTFIEEGSGFGDETNHQINRLKSLELIKKIACSKTLSDVDIAIKKSLVALEIQLQSVIATKPRLQSHIQDLESKIQDRKSKLSRNQKALDAAISKRNDIQDAMSHESSIAKVLGKIELYLTSSRVTTDIEGLKSKIEKLRKVLGDLENEYENNNSEAILISFLNLISKDMSKWAIDLDLEHKGANFRIDLASLSVIADTDSGPILMKDMGSGANWIGCHLIAYFALQKWFAKKNRPVPGFVVIDQPSQAFYPPEDDSENSENLKDEDRQAVAQMYNWLNSMAEELPDIQIIIVDHVDLKQEKWFQDSIVERWRDGKALIPDNW